jgi:hypothetical protein
VPNVRATASAVIPAAPEVVYGVLADYRVGHPSILPPRSFRNLRVLEGGSGAGTRIAYQMVVWGSTRDVQAVITEPAPGRTMVETLEDGTETAFTVAPEPGGRGSRVYAAELRLLSEVASREGRDRA